MIITILELWNNEWWRWYLKDGKAYAFVRDGAMPTSCSPARKPL